MARWRKDITEHTPFCSPLKNMHWSLSRWNGTCDLIGQCSADSIWRENVSLSKIEFVRRKINQSCKILNLISAPDFESEHRPRSGWSRHKKGSWARSRGAGWGKERRLDMQTQVHKEEEGNERSPFWRVRIYWAFQTLYIMVEKFIKFPVPLFILQFSPYHFFSDLTSSVVALSPKSIKTAWSMGYTSFPESLFFHKCAPPLNHLILFAIC